MTHEEILRSCERTDRIFRMVLGDTAHATAFRFGPVLVLLLVFAVIASIVD